MKSKNMINEEDKSFRGYRKKKGYTMEYVANYLNISHQSLSQRELKQVDFNSNECQKLCWLYDVDIREVEL